MVSRSDIICRGSGGSDNCRVIGRVEDKKERRGAIYQRGGHDETDQRQARESPIG